MGENSALCSSGIPNTVGHFAIRDMPLHRYPLFAWYGIWSVTTAQQSRIFAREHIRDSIYILFYIYANS
jgi:hypothetical protein